MRSEEEIQKALQGYEDLSKTLRRQSHQNDREIYRSESIVSILKWVLEKGETSATDR